MTACNDSLKQARSQVQVASARSQVQLTCEELKSLLSRRHYTKIDPLRGSACKNQWFFAISNLLARPSAGIGVVEVQKPMVFLRFLTCSRDPLRGSAWSRCKNPWFFAISNLLARPSAGIGVVEVQKPMVFCDFYPARATLCGDRRGRGAKTHGFLRFLRCSRDPLRGSAWSRCKNPWFFAISILLAQPSAGIGVVEVQKPMFFLRFLRCSRNPLRESAWSRCKNSRFFATFVVRTGPRELSRGWRACPRNRRVAGSIPPWSAGGRRKMQLAFYSNLRRATCAEQVAQSNLRRPTCTDQFAQSALPRATCAEQLTQSNLHRATCTEQLAQSNLQGAQFAQSNLQGPTCRSNLRGATCAEQLAQCNLRRATCADQLAPTSLRRAPCLVLSRACFTKCREKERILQRWADLACDVLLSGQPWSILYAKGKANRFHWTRCH